MTAKAGNRPGEKRLRKIVWNTKDPQGMGALVQRYFDYLRIRRFAENTLKQRNCSLYNFYLWLEMRGIRQPREVTRPIIERYQRYLLHYRKANGESLSVTAIHNRIQPIRGLFRWLTKNNYLLSNPAADIELPRLDKRLPRNVLNPKEAEAVLQQPDVEQTYGLRDRAILETFYSTGIRRMELINLKIHDIDMDRGTMMIYLGKGRKDRMIPIGERAVAWIKKYLLDSRPHLAMEPDDGRLFLNKEGRGFSLNRLTEMVGNYVKKAGVKSGACHMFRHTMATLMLEGGADIRYIQHMLGHAHLNSTEVYTQVSMRKLKEVHTLSHPGATLKGKPAKPAKGKGFTEGTEKQKLFSALAAEEEEEPEAGGRPEEKELAVTRPDGEPRPAARSKILTRPKPGELRRPPTSSGERA